MGPWLEAGDTHEPRQSQHGEQAGNLRHKKASLQEHHGSDWRGGRAGPEALLLVEGHFQHGNGP